MSLPRRSGRADDWRTRDRRWQLTSVDDCAGIARAGIRARPSGARRHARRGSVSFQLALSANKQAGSLSDDPDALVVDGRFTIKCMLTKSVSKPITTSVPLAQSCPTTTDLSDALRLARFVTACDPSHRKSERKIIPKKGELKENDHEDTVLDAKNQIDDDPPRWVADAWNCDIVIQCAQSKSLRATMHFDLYGGPGKSDDL